MIDSFDKLPIGTYTEIIKIDGMEDAVQRQVAILSLLSGLSEDEVLHLPLAEYSDMAKRSQFLSRPDEIGSRGIKPSYTLGGFTCIPVKDCRKMEAGQYIDFQAFIAEPDTHMAEILSVLLVPAGKRYNEGYDIVELQDAIRKEMTVPDGVALLAFFLTWSERSMPDMLNYSEEAAKRIRDKETRRAMLRKAKRLRHLFRRNGDG